MAQVRREAGGAEAPTTASLGIVYRDWLHYRGFVDFAFIEELELPRSIEGSHFYR